MQIKDSSLVDQCESGHGRHRLSSLLQTQLDWGPHQDV